MIRFFHDIPTLLRGLLAGFDPWVAVVVLTGINTLSGMLYFLLGWLCKWEWLERYLHVDLARLERVRRRVSRYGVLAALFSWLPVVGTPIAISLGLLRANPAATATLMAVGTLARNAVVLLAIGQTGVFS